MIRSAVCLQARRAKSRRPSCARLVLPGFLINEIKRRRDVRATRARWQAMIVGLDGRAYFVEVGAVLYDGRVVEISGDEVIFEQDVEDFSARAARGESPSVW